MGRRKLFGEPLREVADEQRNVLPAFPQRRNPDWKDVQPVVQVRTEFPLGDHLFEIAVGGGDQPKVDANGSRAS